MKLYNTLDYFDARLYVGNPFMSVGQGPAEVIDAMENAGVGRAVAIMREQEYASPDRANDLAQERITAFAQLYGLLAIVPGHTGELPPPEAVIRGGFPIKMAGLLLQPSIYRVPLHPLYLADWFETAERRNIPIWFRTTDDQDFIYIADVLSAYPELRIVLGTSNLGPNQRKIYPLAANFPGVYICLSDVYWMGFIEDFTFRFGCRQLLFSTSYPEKYFGSPMLTLYKADIPDTDKAAIAAGNLEALIGGIDRD